MSVVDSTLDVAEFVRQFHGLTRAEFLAANPHPFLLGDAYSILDGDGAFRTMPLPSPEELDEVVDRPTDKQRKPGRALVPERIYPVTKRPGTPFPHMISVGRSGNNDLVLPFGAVSKLHAFFSHVAETDTWTVADAESSNGTFLGTRRLVPHERTPLRDGAQVVFGNVGLSFVSATTMHDSLGELARRLARAGAR